MTGQSSGTSIAALAFFFSVGTGCGTEDGVSTFDLDPTIVEVLPEAFLGDVPCAEMSGALRTYVASLIDLTPEAEEASQGSSAAEVTLPSSAPAPCNRSVLFGRDDSTGLQGTEGALRVMGRHAYAAEIDGYDRADLLQPTPGVPLLVDPETGEPVSPRWTARCGREPREPTVAEFRLTRTVGDCEPFQALDQAATEIELVLNSETCASSELAIDEYLVRRGGVLLGRTSCGEGVIESNVSPGDFVEFEVLGFAAGSALPSVGGHCTGTALRGIRTRASCGPLSAGGGLTVELDELYSALELDCLAPVEQLILTLKDSDLAPLVANSASCRGVAHFQGLAPGDYAVEASAVLRGEAKARKAECTAPVEPGLSARSTCSAG